MVEDDWSLARTNLPAGSTLGTWSAPACECTRTICRQWFPSEPSGLFYSGHIRWFTRSNLDSYAAKTGNLSLGACAANGVPIFNLLGYWRLKPFHDFLFTHLARAWPSVFGYQLIFKLTRVG
jgi:hypothetical protein